MFLIFLTDDLVNKLNVLSGDSFSKSGANVTYGFYVEESGLYNISLKYFISQKNTNVYSKVYVDNKILFEDLNRYGFINKTVGFRNETLNDVLLKGVEFLGY